MRRGIRPTDVAHSAQLGSAVTALAIAGWGPSAGVKRLTEGTSDGEQLVAAYSERAPRASPPAAYPYATRLVR